MSDWQEEHIKRIKQRQEDFEFEVALMLEEEREFNRQKMRETGYRIAIPI